MKLDDDRVKPAHEVRPGNLLAIRVGEIEWQVTVKALSERRGPAEEARKLYEETEASRAERARRRDLRRWGAEPAAALKGRPTKRERRELERFTRGESENQGRRGRS